ncbi:MAG: hypothetical protein VXW65_13855 [Pseudomonadota bacterium]|nr:hypothetical protein [Pseudomonadota bacterium]
MYISRMILLVIFGVFMVPPLLAQIATRMTHGWLIPALVWIVITLIAFWVIRLRNRSHGA